MGGKLIAYIRTILSRFPTLQQVYQRVKGKIGIRNSTNKSITKAYQQAQAERAAGKAFNRAKAASTMQDLGISGPKNPCKIITVNYHFNYDFGRKSSSGKAGKTAVHDSIDLPGDSSKGDINAAVREAIREWMMNYYDAKWTGKGSLPFVVDSIIGC